MSVPPPPAASESEDVVGWAATVGTAEDWTQWMIRAAGPVSGAGGPAGGADALADALTAILAARRYQVAADPAGSTRIDRAARVVYLPAADTDPRRRAVHLAHSIAHLMLHPDVDHAAGPCAGQVRAEALTAAYLVATQAGVSLPPPPLPDAPRWAEHPEAVARRSWEVASQIREELARPTHPDPLTTRLRTGATRTGHLAARVRASHARAGASPPPAAPPFVPDTQRRLYAAMDAAADWYRSRLYDPDGAPARQVLADRGLARVVREDHRWTVGRAPAGWTGLVDHLRTLGFTDDELIAAGLAVPSRRDTVIDLFRDRITIGVRDPHGRLVAFVGRALTAGQTPKYLNSPTGLLYVKSEVLFGRYENGPALAAGATPVLVEGPMDVLAAAAVSLDGGPPVAALAPAGTALTVEQSVALLAAAPDRPGITVAFDPDPAGHRAAAASYALLYGAETHLFQAGLPGLDPADLLRHAGPDALRAALTDPTRLRPLACAAIDDRLRWWLDPDHDRLRFDEHRAAAAAAAAPLIIAERSDLAAGLIRYTAAQIGWPADAVRDVVIEAATDARAAAVHRLADLRTAQARAAALPPGPAHRPGTLLAAAFPTGADPGAAPTGPAAPARPAAPGPRHAPTV